MQKHYNPDAVEQTWYAFWEKSGYFEPNSEGEPYCIMLPPPNVTGTLHMGHGFQVTLMDALIRYHRMRGYRVLWQVGTDHAGIATQMVVERQLLQQGMTRQELGREAFVNKIWDWKGQSDSAIKQQLRRMGASVDWSRERFSLDEEINQAVLRVFVDLYREGLLYRGKRLVNWDPILLTAISDLEVTTQEEEGHLWFIQYPLANGEGSLTVATTRPETILGDTAVAVHPDDPRYQSMIGQFLRHPLTGQQIPIIADTYVDPTFGSGCVKITPAHDFNDYALGQRHHLPIINIFTPSAHLNDTVPEKYRGLERYVARERIVSDLQAVGLISQILPHRLSVPRGDRTGAVLEPLLTDQWYIRTKPLAQAAIEAVQKGEIHFVPENWQKTYFQWLENIEDWCISRQLWWGHRIPAWYDANGQVYVGMDEAEVRQHYHLDPNTDLRQDEDVLDTWVSASLWPFATLGWPKPTLEQQTFYPTQVLVTGFDILFFWVARMVMMGLKFPGQVPFQTVYVTGLIRDSEGQKMSKSKGNILDPLDLIDGITLENLLKKRLHGLMQPEQARRIEQSTRRDFPQGIPAFGTDALRFTYCALANTGRNINFDLGRIGGYQHFCNKLWNAARYVLMQTAEHPQDWDAPKEFGLPERWIRTELQNVIHAVRRHFEQYRFDLLAHTLYEFIWNSYCDWYVEFSKSTLNAASTSEASKRGARYTLLTVLESALRLLHPLMPFITEEIWQPIAKLLGKTDLSIMIQPYPNPELAEADPGAMEDMAWLQQLILGVRQIRSETHIAPSRHLSLLLRNGAPMDERRIAEHGGFLQSLARIESIVWLDPKEAPPPSATAIVGTLELLIPMAGLVDIGAEIARIDKEIQKLEVELLKTQTKLANPDYLAKAPAAVVAKEQARHAEIIGLLEKLTAQKKKL